MDFSKEQLRFLNAVETSRGSIVLEAVAGSGKTTTILEAATRVQGGCALLAYNKKIADEIKLKLEQRGIDWKQARAGTCHSFGMTAYRKAYPEVKISDDKLYVIANKMISKAPLGCDGDSSLKTYQSGIVNLVGLAKQSLIGVGDRSLNHSGAWRDLIEHHDVDFGGNESVDDEAIYHARLLLKASCQVRDIIDFNDMIYMPLLLNLKFWEYGTVFLDEAQDTNEARRELCRRLIRRGGRLIAVGDPHQAIYGFTGASHDALDLIREDFDAMTMPLSVTFRCPKYVVDFSHEWVSHIQAHPNAIDGEVGRLTFDQVIANNERHRDTAILCRNAQPLISAAFSLIRQGVSCRVEGRDIGKNLLKIANRWKVTKLETFETKLDEFVSKEKAKLEARKAKPAAVAAFEDRIATIKVIIEQCLERGQLTVSQLRKSIEDLFDDNVKDQIVLSTIHKSKGREWKHVLLLDRIELFTRSCERSANQPWQIEQEKNLMYVAATRSLETLNDVTSFTLPTRIKK